MFVCVGRYVHVYLCVNMVPMSLLVCLGTCVHKCMHVYEHVCVHVHVHGTCEIMHVGALCVVGRTKEAFESLPSLRWRRDWREGFGIKVKGVGLASEEHKSGEFS